MRIDHDALVIGAGGAGLWAALDLARAGVSTGVLTKLYPTRSHTGATLGGASVGAGRVELRQDARGDAGPGEIERRPEARPAGADDERVVVDSHPAAFLLDREREGHDRHRPHQEERDPGQVQQHRQGGSRPAVGVVLDHRPDPHEAVEDHHREQQPVDGPPQDTPPPLVDDPLGRLVGRVEEEMRDREVAQREHEQGEPRQAHQVPDAQLEPTPMRARPTGWRVDRHQDAPAQIGRRMMYAPGRPCAAAERFLADGAGRVVIKAQVLVGGRGKAGGVKLAGSPAEAEEVAGRILGMEIKGIPVRKVLVGPAAVIVKEFYLGAILDRASRRIVLMASAEGGVEIEEVAKATPEAIHRVEAHPLLGLLDWQARELAFAVGLAGPHLRDFVKIAKGLVATMRANDADLVEVNPLAILRESGPEGQVERLACLDAKVTLDDSALPRHPDLEKLRDLDEEDPADAEARHYDISFIHLDGSIGCMVNGAGLAMTTMDLVNRAGGAPANFLDIGGGAKADRVSAAMRLILADPKVRAILVNIFGGITRGDEVARGLIDARARQEREVPMVVRIVGTNAEEAARLLREAAVETAATLDEAAAKAVAAARQATGDAA